MLSIICPRELWEHIESIAPIQNIWNQWAPHFCLTSPCQWRLLVVPWQTGQGGPDKPMNIQPNTNKVLVQCDLFIILIYLFQAKSKLSEHWLVLPWKCNIDKNQTVIFYALQRLIGRAILLVINFVCPTVVWGNRGLYAAWKHLSHGVSGIESRLVDTVGKERVGWTERIVWKLTDYCM